MMNTGSRARGSSQRWCSGTTLPCRAATGPTRRRKRRWATTALPIHKVPDGKVQGRIGSCEGSPKTTI